MDEETGNDTDTTPVPSRVFGNGVLLIDAEINKRKTPSKAPRIRDQISDCAISVGRRALEVAILASFADRASNPPRAEIDDGWIAIRDGAKNADKAVRALLFALKADGRFARSFRAPLGQLRVGGPNFRSGSLEQTLASERRAKRDALILIAARKIMAGIAIDSERRRLDIVANLPPKSSDIEKHAFVLILYEAWIFLMGVRPGSSPVLDGNPFLQFVEAAWRDWKGEDEIWESRDKRTSFVRSLALAQSSTSDMRANLLVETGPSWL